MDSENALLYYRTFKFLVRLRLHCDAAPWWRLGGTAGGRYRGGEIWRPGGFDLCGRDAGQVVALSSEVQYTFIPTHTHTHTHARTHARTHAHTHTQVQFVHRQYSFNSQSCNICVYYTTHKISSANMGFGSSNIQRYYTVQQNMSSV